MSECGLMKVLLNILFEKKLIFQHWKWPAPGNLHCISCICALSLRSGTDSPGGVCVSQPPTNTTASLQFSAQLNLLVSYVQYARQSARQSVHYQHCSIQHFTSKNHHEWTDNTELIWNIIVRQWTDNHLTDSAWHKSAFLLRKISVNNHSVVLFKTTISQQCEADG